MFYLYILQSNKSGRFYIGIAEDVKRRLELHNSGKVKSTKHYRPWIIRKIERYPDRSIANRRERFIKAKNSRKIIEKIIDG